MRLCIHTHILTRTYIHIYIFVYTLIYILYMYSRVHMLLHMCVCVCVCVCLCVCICMRVCIHLSICSHIYIYIYICTHVQEFFFSLRTYIGRTKMAFEELDPRRHSFWLFVKFLEVYVQKNLEATILSVNFAKAFDSIHCGKTEHILLACGLLKETVAAIIMLYKSTKVKVNSPDDGTDYFNIVAGVLQGDTLAPYLFITCLYCVLKVLIKWKTTVSSWQRKELEDRLHKQVRTRTKLMT